MGEFQSHPITQPIKAIVVIINDRRPGEQYEVGAHGVTRIEATEKPGEYCFIPYVRVWKGEIAVAEFCQHAIVGIYFDQEPAGVAQDQGGDGEAE